MIAKSKPVIRQTTKATSTKEQNALAPKQKFDNTTPIYGGSGIDNALDTMTHVATKQPASQTKVEVHPEKRHGPALLAYEAANIPLLRKENPSLRLSQIKELVWKQWQKSPDNPFNQVHMNYNTTKQERLDAKEAVRSKMEERLQINP